jgi:ABC-type branched-subunit amino acid transport system ATPase component
MFRAGPRNFRDLVRAFGDIVAVDNFSLDVYRGTIHGLIARTAPGKTATFNVICGFYVFSGKATYLGEDISGQKPAPWASLG